jgi:hypothetical protein
MFKSYKPDVFEFSVLGLPYFNETSLLWHGDALVYYRGSEEREFYPSEGDWVLFWSTLDRIGAWDRQGEYVNASVLDGEHWSLKIIYGDKEISSSGSNSYPGGFDEFRGSLNLLALL